jgi:hypothetical protein
VELLALLVALQNFLVELQLSLQLLVKSRPCPTATKPSAGIATKSNQTLTVAAAVVSTLLMVAVSLPGASSTTITATNRLLQNASV